MKPAPPTAGPAHGHGLRATPLARSVARQHGVALADVKGSGRRGRVQVADVRAALQSTDAAELAAEVKLLSEQAVGEVRGLLAHCGADPEPVPIGQLDELGLLA